ncbi:16S rRNA (uracil(1498)-N(3))-methyltransferase [Helicobacter sp. 13S00477-4]|uniref:16S rRNA (uracil(1498)-N(3))-methyltransferase n=1 Tax=Helicobacter sp. 13S00477-4 TaxID=1905759 RepID=UPI000BA69EA6|nr:16S rRNA (uracil(1498)-N(3))-methyltransferase [Helicobacter sp. 13S00477-4]PAF52273.1 16S rRNA (uracil(1498)-N(3))-methyltransferase [Helicobacter sp. 13S00477-4]
MHFAYHKDAKTPSLKIEGNLYNHIYQSRRTKLQENILLRNLKDDYLYTYKHINISRNHSELKLQESLYLPILPKKYTHLIWSIIQTKNIEKILPYLNQIGVSKITFFYANRSQKNEKISLDKLEKILISSCEQCGRSSIMTLEIMANTQEILQAYPKCHVFDFGGKNIYQNPPDLTTGILIGPEGGFDPQEKILFKDNNIYTTPQNITLKSECAALILASLGNQ